MPDMRRLNVTRLVLDHTVQRPFTGNAEKRIDKVWITNDGDLSAEIYINWTSSTGVIPASVTVSTGIPLSTGLEFGDNTVRLNEYPQVDFRHLVLQADAADDGKYLSIYYWEVVESVNPRAA